MWAYVLIAIGELRARWKAVYSRPDAGYASEAVLVTALLVLGAIVVITIIIAKVTSKANEIDLGLLMQTVAP